MLESPLGIIFIGFILVSIGVLVPLLMVIGVIPAGFILSFISYFASVAGMIVGLIGAAFYIRERKD